MIGVCLAPDNNNNNSGMSNSNRQQSARVSAVCSQVHGYINRAKMTEAESIDTTRTGSPFVKMDDSSGAILMEMPIFRRRGSLLSSYHLHHPSMPL